MSKNSFASHPKAKYWSEKNNCQPKDVPLNSHTLYWFDCDKCDHDFQKKPNVIVALKTWCMYCTNQTLCNDEDCEDCFSKSFASHEYAIYWSYEKNLVTPREVFLGSKKDYWFKCFKCNHEFLKKLKRIKATNSWCQFCNSTLLCEEKCEYCFNKSLASDPRSQYFVRSESGKKPNQIVKKGLEVCTFKCPDCEHEFSSIIGSIVCGDQWCSFCSSRRWCEDKTCEKCFNMSFASNEKAQYIVDKSIDLSRVRKSYRDKHDFCCEKCNNVFSKVIDHISQGSWCPKCYNKGELKLFDTLKIEYPNIECQKLYNWCKGDKGRCFPFDFVISDKKIIIELDGDQHFRHTNPKWRSPEEQRKRDVYKMLCANKQQYFVIRLLQTDVLYNKNNWKSFLDNAIKNISNAEKNIVNQYISKNGVYANHMTDLEKENPLIKNILLGS